jgi:hypothetical protein
MSSPCIDLDMNLLSSPDPPALGASGRGGDTGTADDDGTMDDFRFDPSMMHASSSHDQYHSTFDSRNESEHNMEDDHHHDSGTTERVGHSNCDEHHSDNPSTTTTTTQQQHYAAMSEQVESWREELYMMNVENSILLDDLVTLGADV